jgi:hypothetical protein
MDEDDVYRLTDDEYSIMHVAARNGHHEIVAQLLRRGIEPMFATPPMQDSPEDTYIPSLVRAWVRGYYIPCPLYLAAACSHREVHNIMVIRCKCPYGVESDSLMLLSVGLRPFLYYCINRKDFHIHGVKLPKKGTVEHRHMDDREIMNECWLSGLAIRREHDLLKAVEEILKPTPPNPGGVGSYNMWIHVSTCSCSHTKATTILCT